MLRSLKVGTDGQSVELRDDDVVESFLEDIPEYLLGCDENHRRGNGTGFKRLIQCVNRFLLLGLVFHDITVEDQHFSGRQFAVLHHFTQDFIYFLASRRASGFDLRAMTIGAKFRIGSGNITAMAKEHQLDRLMDAHRHIAIRAFKRMAAPLTQKNTGVAASRGYDQDPFPFMHSMVETLPNFGREEIYEVLFDFSNHVDHIHGDAPRLYEIPIFGELAKVTRVISGNAERIGYE